MPIVLKSKHLIKLVSLQIILLVPLICNEIYAQRLDAKDPFQIARVKYGGGGDWYSNPTSLPNLLSFISQNTDIITAVEEVIVELANPKLFSYPYLYLNAVSYTHLRAHET